VATLPPIYIHCIPLLVVLTRFELYRKCLDDVPTTGGPVDGINLGIVLDDLLTFSSTLAVTMLLQGFEIVLERPRLAMQCF
jgi:hypothetical protein